jgi:hypothetical protein
MQVKQRWVGAPLGVLVERQKKVRKQAVNLGKEPLPEVTA